MHKVILIALCATLLTIPLVDCINQESDSVLSNILNPIRNCVIWIFRRPPPPPPQGPDMQTTTMAAVPATPTNPTTPAGAETVEDV